MFLFHQYSIGNIHWHLSVVYYFLFIIFIFFCCYYLVFLEIIKMTLTLSHQSHSIFIARTKRYRPVEVNDEPQQNRLRCPSPRVDRDPREELPPQRLQRSRCSHTARYVAQQGSAIRNIQCHRCGLCDRCAGDEVGLGDG